MRQSGATPNAVLLGANGRVGTLLRTAMCGGKNQVNLWGQDRQRTANETEETYVHRAFRAKPSLT